MSVYSGDFLGFTLGNVHSSQLNITRVSSGDRYEDILLPKFKDTTVEVPGGDGTYYWGTFYNQRPFTLNFAYDDLRDEDLRALRQLFSFKGIKPLIFDEFPYKKYMVKAAAPPQFKYICFDYKDVRLYKGEGSVQLVAYYPYAFEINPVRITGNKTLYLSNVGDLNADLKLYTKFLSDDNNIPQSDITLKNSAGKIVGELHLNTVYKQGEDKGILIDNTTHLIEGIDNNSKKTGNLYNSFIKSGDFFTVPVGRNSLDWICTTGEEEYYRTITAEYTPLYY